MTTPRLVTNFGPDSPEPEAPDPACKTCGKPTRAHLVDGDYRCCRCYVLEGDCPADWHAECMATWYEMHPEKAPAPPPISGGSPEADTPFDPLADSLLDDPEQGAKSLGGPRATRTEDDLALTMREAAEEIRQLRARTLDLEAALDDLLRIAREHEPHDTAKMREAHRLLYPARAAR